MTASRALSGAGKVSPEKIKSIFDAAAELGYRRNENARSLRPGQKTGLIGVVITNAANPYYSQLQMGIEEYLSPLGMRMLVGNTGDDNLREQRLITDFIGWNVDGLIVVPSGETEALAQSPVPIVLASRSAPGAELDTVLIDDVEGSRTGTMQLVREGHRRIAFLGLGMSVSTSERRLRGFKQALASGGIVADESLIHQGRSSADDPQVSARELLSMDDPATAVFAANNRNTIAMMHALNETPRPHTLRIAGFDSFDTADLMPVHATLVDHDPQELGRRAAELLVQRLDGFTGDPVVVELPTTLLM